MSLNLQELVDFHPACDTGWQPPPFEDFGCPDSACPDYGPGLYPLIRCQQNATRVCGLRRNPGDDIYALFFQDLHGLLYQALVQSWQKSLSGLYYGHSGLFGGYAIARGDIADRIRKLR